MLNIRAAVLAAPLASCVFAVATPARAQSTPQQSSAQTSGQQASGPQACPGNPDALGTSRVIAVDPSQISRVGRMQYPDSLPLADKEVVLTFDDGPLPPYSNKILDILASECVKATYFMVGSMARAYPATVRRVYEEGHTIGTHSENHPTHFGTLPIETMRHEIDAGIADVSAALGDPKYLAPFFRIPGLARSDTVESELAARSLIVFSSDTVADDWHHGIKPNQIIALALKRLEARGKGILLLHDIHPTTAAALPGLLRALKDNGFRIVQVVPSASYMIAMAARPAHPMVASAMPLSIAVDDDASAAPAWPQTTADLTPDTIALPAPDASAFEPDSGVADDGSAVQWPAQPNVAAASRGPQPPRKAGKKIAASFRHGNGHERGQQRSRETRLHGHRARVGAVDHPADAMSRIKAFANLFSPAPAAH